MSDKADLSFEVGITLLEKLVDAIAFLGHDPGNMAFICWTLVE
jgi:hypothetical protein